jgi:hypothetical protein
MDDNQNQLKLKEKQKNPYSNKYRYIKTVLMIYAWVSFGIQLGNFVLSINSVFEFYYYYCCC